MRALGPLVGRLGFDLEVRHFYSPIPDRASLAAAPWDHASAMAGVDFDLAGQMRFLEQELGGYIREFGPPRHATGRQHEFFLDNGFYQAVDAHVLYAMIRRLKPARVLELGAGFSTLVSAAAVTANAREAIKTRLETFDPYAKPPAQGGIEGLEALRPIAAEDLGEHEFGQLTSGDILFVDTSHTVKLGGDVTHLVLEVLPRLAPGVVVHFHDIFLPWHYPRSWVEHNRWYWAEQYLLQAFLTFNRDFEVLAACHALWREYPQRLGELIPAARDSVPPLALWLRRRTVPAVGE